MERYWLLKTNIDHTIALSDANDTQLEGDLQSESSPLFTETYPHSTTSIHKKIDSFVGNQLDNRSIAMSTYLQTQLYTATPSLSPALKLLSELELSSRRELLTDVGKLDSNLTEIADRNSANSGGTTKVCDETMLEQMALEFFRLYPRPSSSTSSSSSASICRK